MAANNDTSKPSSVLKPEDEEWSDLESNRNAEESTDTEDIDLVESETNLRIQDAQKPRARMDSPDVKIRLNGGGKIILIHEEVVTKASSYYNQKLSTQKSRKLATKEINVTCTDRYKLHKMIDLLYEDTFTVAAALEFVQFAHETKFDLLSAQLAEVLAVNVTKSNYLQIKIVALELMDEKLNKVVDDYFQEHVDNVLKTTDFAKRSFEKDVSSEPVSSSETRTKLVCSCGTDSGWSSALPALSQTAKKKKAKKEKLFNRREKLLSLFPESDQRFYSPADVAAVISEYCPNPSFRSEIRQWKKSVLEIEKANVADLDNINLPTPLECPACGFRTLDYSIINVHLTNKMSNALRDADQTELKAQHNSSSTPSAASCPNECTAQTDQSTEQSF